ncbi:hypothetical protein D0866_04984 [Hortaea werneckii]|uniref:Uncharacterized protein n=2 Tax=Hortaea werneckii TaxID=91943 RepID=A0A3M7B513_HORWE|nr:hypothetical protein D0866_04984 [Hortaea werneckii]
MNGSVTPDGQPDTAADELKQEDASPALNGHQSPTAPQSHADGEAKESATAQDDASRAEPAPAVSNVQARLNGGDEDAQSEAETLIDSPVKKREAAKANESAQSEKPPRSRIGGLPVFGDEEDEEEDESIATPVQSTETGDAKAGSGANVKEQGADGEVMDSTRGNDDGSESLSSARSSQSAESSRESSRERAMSEKAERRHDGGDSPNPRKRKKRASSVEFPSKRRSMDVPSMDVPKRQLRGLYSEDNAIRDERSQSPHLRHRRTHSTQSAFMDGAAENNARKRRAVTQFPVRDPKTGKNGWEESDASSETASHGQVEARRPQRGIGRSTSTPGRPAGGGKRHVNKYGFTKLAEACEQDDLDAVRKWREQDPDQIELAEFAGNKPLQIAALNGNDQVVAYLIDQGCQIDCANVDKDTPLIDAAENGHLEVVKILLHAGVDPLRQNLKGQQALDVVTDDTDDADSIRAALRQAIEKWNSSDAKQRREEEEEQRHRAGPSKELHFMARTYENLLRLVEINDRNGVREFLDARVPVDNVVIALAAKTGDQYLVNMLLAEMTEKKAYSKSEKPMMAVLGTSHFDMVKLLTELDQFKPDWRDRKGRSWPELAEEKQGPNWKAEKELLQRLHDDWAKAQGIRRRSSSPVTKREGSKPRRVPQDASDEESDNDEAATVMAPKRKNGRRLMSRKDMRAASGKPFSDSEDGEEPERTVMNGEMGPPDSPGAKHSTLRQRSKSQSMQPAEETSSPRARRRSSASLRRPSDSVMPALDEKEEEKPTEEVEAAKQKEAEAQFVIHEARRLEAKRRDEEAAEKEAKKAEEETKAAEERREAEEARLREAEEEQKRLEEERARREAEETRRAEEARKAEEAFREKQVKMEDARRTHIADLLAALPKTLQYALDQQSGFAYGNDEEVAYLQEHFLPLLVVREDNDGPWVLNIQAAPLLGKRGLEVLLPQTNELEFDLSLSGDWPKFNEGFSTRDRANISRAVSSLTRSEGEVFDEDIEMADSEDGPSIFHCELQRIAGRLNAQKATKARLLSEEHMPLRLVKLTDVLANLHPILKDTPTEVEYLTFPAKAREVALQLDKQATEGFIERWQALSANVVASETYTGARLAQDIAEKENRLGRTEVVVVHEK